MSVVYDYQVTDMDGPGMCGVADPSIAGHFAHLDRSSGTLCTVATRRQ